MSAEQQNINYGASANDGTGDPLRTAFIKTDENFSNIWAAGPVGSNVTITNNTISVINTNGNLVLSPNGVGIVQTNNSIVPRFGNSYDLGTSAAPFRSTHTQGVYAANYYYANGAPFSGGGGGDYGNANVAAFLPTYNGNIGNIQVTALRSPEILANQVSAFNSLIGNLTVDNLTVLTAEVANVVNVNNLVNEFPINITTNGGDTWQFAGNILRGPQGGTWQSSASTAFFTSPANGYINISSLFGGNVVSEIFMEHSFIKFFVDNGTPEKNWQMNLDGTFDVPGDIIPQSNGVHSLGNATNQWGELWVAGNTVYINSVPITVGAGNVLTVAGQPVLSNDSNSSITTTGNITATAFIGDGSQLTNLPGGDYGNANVAAYLPTYGGNILVDRVTGNTANNLGYVQWDGNSSGDNNGYTTLRLVPDETLVSNDQYLIVDPTAPTHIHIRAGGTIDDSSAELYLGGERNYVRVVDGTGVRLYNETRNDNFSYFTDPADFNTATWYGTPGNYFVEYTAVASELGDLAFAFADDDENRLTVYYSGGAFSQTLTYGGSSSNLGGGVYRVAVVQAPPESPTVLTALEYQIWTTRDNSVALQNNDFTVEVDDDIRITGNDTFSLRNRSATDAITIRTDYDGADHVWEFGADGRLTLPSNGNIIFPSNGQIVMDNGDGTIGNQGDDFVISWDNEDLVLRSAAGDVDVESDTDFNVRVNYDGGAGDYLTKWIFTQNNDIVNITGNSSIVTEAGNLNLQGGRDTLSSGNVQITAVDNGVAVNTWTFDNAGVLTLPGEGVLQSIDDTVVLSSFNTSTGNANSIYLGSSGGVGFYDQEIGGNWLEIFRNGAEPEIRVPVGRGNLNIQTAEGENSYNWRFDNTGNLNVPGNIIVSSGVLVGNVTGTATTATSLISGNSGVEFAAPGANIELTVGGVGIVNISSNTVGVTGNISGGNIITSGSVNTGGNINLTSAEATDTARIFADVSGSNTSMVLEVGDDDADAVVLRHYSFAASNTIDMLRAQRSSNTTANVTVTGNVIATGNVTAQNFTGNISITGNVTGTSPNVSLVAGSYTYTFDNIGVMTLPAVSGNEGGEIQFTQAANSTLSGNTVTVDSYVDQIRIFEGGGTARGVYIDLSQAAAGVGTLLNNRVSAFVDAGTFVTMDNIRATVTSSGNRGLSLATTTGSITYNIGGTYGGVGGTGGLSVNAQTLTTTPTTSIFGWNFGAEGEASTYVLVDKTNNRSYRITVSIGPAYLGNMISIERLI